jgi:hypothetical protein
MVSDETPCQDQKKFIGGARGEFAMVSEVEKEGGHDEHVKGIDPGTAGLCIPANHEFPAVIEQQQTTDGKKNRVEPGWGGGAFESDIEEEGGNHQQMKDRQKKMNVYQGGCHTIGGKEFYAGRRPTQGRPTQGRQGDKADTRRQA